MWPWNCPVVYYSPYPYAKNCFPEVNKDCEIDCYINLCMRNQENRQCFLVTLLNCVECRDTEKCLYFWFHPEVFLLSLFSLHIFFFTFNPEVFLLFLFSIYIFFFPIPFHFINFSVFLLILLYLFLCHCFLLFSLSTSPFLASLFSVRSVYTKLFIHCYAHCQLS
jgi:hypothetical protein